MCGIIGYIGNKEAYSLLLSGLERLEYRGYDSAGITTVEANQIYLNKKKGRVAILKTETLPGRIGIGHTRWATHGKPLDQNAHPFLDEKKRLTVVHNGIIENYLELKEELRKKGINFRSDTDSEVIVHLIAEAIQEEKVDEQVMLKALTLTVKRLQGSYAFCVLHKNLPTLFGIRNGSPLIAGIGKGENFFSSDAAAIIEHTKEVIYLQDFQIALLNNEKAKIFDFCGKEQPFEIKEIAWNLEQAQKRGYPHFMLKEIFEQPQVVEDALNHKLYLSPRIYERIRRIIIVGCGSAYYGGLIGKHIIEQISHIHVENEIASEFRYKENFLSSEDLIIVISQSGETADTLAALRLAKQSGARTLAIINVVGSTIAREAEEVIYTRAGPEIGVASTKALISQLMILYQLSFHLAKKEFYPEGLLDVLKKTLLLNESIRELAQRYYTFTNFVFIGRKMNYPLALEGALKLKEISYLHAEAYPAGELKHGPIALISEEMPTLAICPQDEVYEKTISNMEEIKARNGRIIALATVGDEKVKNITSEIIYIPKIEGLFYPLVLLIPLQLFAYHVADLRECDIDKPRNLAKSVTVE